MRLLLYFLSAVALFAWHSSASAEPRPSVAMQGEPALAAGFSSFPYANPDAPKGGDITHCVVGSFDNLNPFILKSLRSTARGVIDTIYGNLVFEPLMQRSYDEPFSLYGLLAQSIDMTPDRKVATFALNPAATWSDGAPVTADDVIFTYEVFTAKGRPPYSDRMKKIAALDKIDAHTVRFTFNDQADREFPLIIALTPIVPKHFFKLETFDQTTLTPIVGSGPYRIAKVVPGERIVFERNRGYWARDIPSKRGFDNFDRITIEYFLNANAQFEAFKKGICSTYSEPDPVKRKRGFNFPALENGSVVAETFETGIPPVVSGFLFNTRLSKFADPKVRRALAMLYDFEWVNLNVYDGQFQRTSSFWQGTELSALGRPATSAEAALLAPFQGAVEPEIMDGTWQPARTDGSGRDRKVLKAALDILKGAGFTLKAGTLLDSTGQPFAFEILTSSQSEERLAAVYQRTLQKIGIGVTIRALDDVQMQQRKQRFDFEVLIGTTGFSGSLSPGIEQLSRWGSASRNTAGSFNLAGVAEPAIDAVLAAMLNAPDKENYVSAVRALDRLLMSGAYMVPMQHNTQQFLAYWNVLAHPAKTPIYGYQLPVWWRKTE